MEEKHKVVLLVNFRKILALQLKNWAARGKLIKIKAFYKLSKAGKNGKPSATTKGKIEKAEKKSKPSSKPKKFEAAKNQAKKVVAKRKTTPAKPKQPKSIKSPAAKKTKKVTA
ncbi:hypothetical protein PTKIN_Ptkin06aG0073400 [Pterospermum kingtungense]